MMLFLRNLEAKAIGVEPFILIDLLLTVNLQSRFILTIIDLCYNVSTLEYSTPISSLSIFCKQASFDLYI